MKGDRSEVGCERSQVRGGMLKGTGQRSEQGQCCGTSRGECGGSLCGGVSRHVCVSCDGSASGEAWLAGADGV